MRNIKIKTGTEHEKRMPHKSRLTAFDSIGWNSFCGISIAKIRKWWEETF